MSGDRQRRSVILKNELNNSPGLMGKIIPDELDSDRLCLLLFFQEQSGMERLAAA
jgi:hypothetical protein